MFKIVLKFLILSIVILSAFLLYQKHTYAYHALVRIDPIVHTKELLAEEKYADAQEYLEYFMDFDYVKESSEAQELLKDIDEHRSSIEYNSQKILEGITTGTSDELSGQLGAIGSDFFVVGDIRDLIIQTNHYLNDEEVDNVLVALSSIGLVATASTLVTLGGSSAAKGSVSVMKLAQKSKRLPKWLSKYLLRQAKQVKKTKSIKAIEPLLKNVDAIYKQVGLKNTLKLLSNTKDIKALQSVSKLSKRYGKNTPMLLKLSKGGILKNSKKMSNFSKSSVHIASSYGESGYKVLMKNGEKNFLKSIKRIKAYTKVGYRGEAWKIFIWLLKNVSDAVLIGIMIIGTLLLIPWRSRARAKAS